ncbi:MAG: hypothetical protein ACREJ5_13865 [Geminicoccaceae bacterium]
MAHAPSVGNRGPCVRGNDRVADVGTRLAIADQIEDGARGSVRGDCQRRRGLAAIAETAAAAGP